MNSSNKGTIYSKTWEKDSYGLFDYEKAHVKLIQFEKYFTGTFYRNNMSNIVKLKEKPEEEDSDQFLADLVIENNKIMLSKKVENNLPINNSTLTNLQEQIWHVVRSSSNVFKNKSNVNHKYELKKNDIIKLGRIKFVVKDLNIVAQQIQSSIETFVPYFNNDSNKEGSDSICRICYVSESTNDNPLISVCKCKGSMILHASCLKKWIESKWTVNEKNGKPVVSYTVKSFNCEICREPYPITIKSDNSYLNLINYSVPENQNYLVLQSLNSIKENEYPLSIHVMMFIENNSYFNLGRGHESDIRILDISVSRLHAKISMQNNKIYIEDKVSKFGTLVLTKEPVDLMSQTMFQIGRTLIYYKEEKKREIQSSESDAEEEEIENDDEMDGEND